MTLSHTPTKDLVQECEITTRRHALPTALLHDPCQGTEAVPSVPAVVNERCVMETGDGDRISENVNTI